MALSNLTRAAAKALRKQRTPATAILVAAGSATRMGGIDKAHGGSGGPPAAGPQYAGLPAVRAD